MKPPSTARTAGRSDWAERRFRRQPFILLSFSSSKKLRKAQETQSYQRFQHIVHTVFNTSGTNGPHSLLRMKVGTHSALLKESHTADHTPKQGPSGRGRYHYPRSVPHVHKHPRAGYQNGVLCRFWVLAGRCSRRTQKAFGTAMRLCVLLFRRRRGPAGLRNSIDNVMTYCYFAPPSLLQTFPQYGTISSEIQSRQRGQPL